MTRNFVPDMQIHRKWEGWGQGLWSQSEQLGEGNLCDLLTSDIMGSPPPHTLNRETRPKTLKLVATSFVILHTGIFSTTSQEEIQKKHPIEPTLLTWEGGGASLISPKKRGKLCKQWESDSVLYFRIQPSSKTKQAAMVDQWCVWRPIMAMLL